MKPVRVLSKAESDLDGHAAYLESRRRGLARRLLLAFQRTVRRIGRAPEAIALYGFEEQDLCEIRACPMDEFDNLLVFFRVTADEAEVLRVLHGARDIDSMKAEILPDAE